MNQPMPVNPPNLRSHLVTASTMPWQPTQFDGIEMKILYSDDEGNPHVQLPSAWTSQWHFAEIPFQLAVLKRDNIERAKAWQFGLREALGGAFAHGYHAVDFGDDGKRCWYMLEKS